MGLDGIKPFLLLEGGHIPPTRNAMQSSTPALFFPTVSASCSCQLSLCPILLPVADVYLSLWLCFLQNAGYSG